MYEIHSVLQKKQCFSIINVYLISASIWVIAAYSDKRNETHQCTKFYVIHILCIDFIQNMLNINNCAQMCCKSLICICVCVCVCVYIYICWSAICFNLTRSWLRTFGIQKRNTRFIQLVFNRNHCVCVHVHVCRYTHAHKMLIIS